MEKWYTQMKINLLKLNNKSFFNQNTVKIYKLKKHSNGMTAMELMTVVVILGVLVTVVGLNFIKTSKKRSLEASVQTNMRTLQIMLENYKVDWQVYPPDLNTLSIEADQKKYNKVISNPFTNVKAPLDSTNIWAVDFVDPTSPSFISNHKLYEGKVGYQFINLSKYYLVGYGEDGFPIEKSGKTYLVTNG